MRYPLYAIIFVLLVPASYADAQLFLPGSSASSLSISVSPEYPQPNSSATLTLSSIFHELGSSMVRWSVNGNEVDSGTGRTTISVPTGAPGTVLDVVADISGPSGEGSVGVRLVPATVDLLWEADSLVPPFYRGRALPSAGTNVRVVALPHIPSTSGGEVPASELTYTWRKDNQILEEFSGKGRSSALIESPTLFGAAAIVVEARAQNGAGARAILRVADVAPTLTLYESTPLLGTLYHRALEPSTFVPENEMSFTAIPYFAPAPRASDRSLRYEWRVNGMEVAPDPKRPNELTINASASEGVALVELGLSHSSNYFFGTDGAWSVTFNRRFGESTFGGFGPQR